jgi:predicted dinucleotide-binding enzyme
MHLCAFKVHSRNAVGRLLHPRNEFDHFRRARAAPSANVAAVAIPFDKRPDIHFECSRKFQSRITVSADV